MTIIVETGTGSAAAESYASVAFATAYHAKRGNTTWADLENDEREAALIKATDYMRVTYRDAWRGVRAGPLQALDWPRHRVYVDGYEVGAATVPDDIARACAELAARSAIGDALLPDLEQQVVSEKVGPIAVVYDNTSPQHKRFAIVDRMLAPYLIGIGPIVRIGRA